MVITRDNIDGVIFSTGIYYYVDLKSNNLYEKRDNDNFEDLKNCIRRSITCKLLIDSWITNINNGGYKYIRHYNRENIYELW